MALLNISRRNVTLGTLCAGLVLGASSQVAKSEKKESSVRITALSDGHFDLPAAAFSSADPSALSSIDSSVRAGANVWLLTTSTRRILVDTGSGETLSGKYPYTGQLPHALVGAGVDPASITDIVITHMHADHIGGLMLDGKKAYPNATLHIGEQEWAFWTDPDRPSNIAAGLKPLSQLIQKIASELDYDKTMHNGQSDLGEGLWLEPAPGHTPGHFAVRIEGGPQQVLLLGDAMISDAIQFAHPGVTYGLDNEPELAAETRKALFDMIVADNIAIAATHLNTQALLGLSRNKDGYQPHLI